MRLRWMGGFMAAITAIGLSSCGGDGDSSRDVQIRRTAYGVPHILASDPQGLGMGVGYAFAEDNMCLLADAVVTITGERSKFFGATATYDSYADPAQVNLPSDFFYKVLNESSLVQASWDRQPEEVKQLLLGYAEGYNRFLAEAPSRSMQPLCLTEPWVRPLTELDLVRLMRRFAVEAGSARFINAFYAAQPPGSASPMSTGARAKPVDAKLWTRFDTQLGSNAVALGKQATQSGRGMLFGNPHYPWGNIFRFYQMHLTIPGQLNVMGASLTGSPAVNIGFNEHLAWSHTVNTSRHFTLFYLQLDPADPTRYLVDGQSRAMTKKMISVEVGVGPTTTVTRDIYMSDYGPLVTLPGTLDWTAQAAYAMRDANLDNDRVFQQWWEMNKATTMDAYREAVEGILGIPWANTVATDHAGNTYYADVTPVPYVSDAKVAACVAAPFQPLIDANSIYVLAGNTAACNWDDDPSTPHRGIFPASQLPTLLRDDYVQNSNDSAWMTHASARLTGFPGIVSQEDTQLSGRTRIGLTQIAARLAGTDGRPGNKFDLPTLQDIVFSNKSYFATVLLDDLRTACTPAGNVTLDDSSTYDITQACTTLVGWDGRAELTSVGWPLFQAWRDEMLDSGGNFWLHAFDAADPVATPSGLLLSDPAVVTSARKALAKAAKALEDQGLDYTRPWGELQSFTRDSTRIPIHGGAGNDIYNQMVTTPRFDGTLEVRAGSSTVWAVSFENGSPIAEGFLSYSQSTDPNSPHYADQTPLFSRKEWIRFPFTEEEIASDPQLTVTVLRR